MVSRNRLNSMAITSQKLSKYRNKIQYKFQSVGGNDDESWGFRSSAPLNEINLDEPFEFNGIAYGGCNDRIYKYDNSSPTDIPWLSSILDPVIHAELTNDEDPQKLSG